MEQQKTETSQATRSSGIQPIDMRAPSWTEQRAIRRGNRELVTDVDGVEWEVTESRKTKHGFKLLLGLPTLRRNIETGGRRIILTTELFNYCHECRTIRGAQFDLPLSVYAIHKLRRRLGLNYSRDSRALWEARAEELKLLPLTVFAQRHKVSYSTAQQWRRKLHGAIARPHNWWQSADGLEILLSGLTRPEKAIKLGISASYVCALIPRAQDFVNQREAA